DDTRFDQSEWLRVQADLTSTSLVSARDLILPILGGPERAEDRGITRLDYGRGRVLTPREISGFYRTGSVENRQVFRRMIANHLSMWDIAVDDSLIADVPILWPWESDREFRFWQAHHVGFKWITNDTRDLLGMEGPQPIYTYHPIYLLGWWALNFGRALQGQTFEGLSDEELENAILTDGFFLTQDAPAGEHLLHLNQVVGLAPGMIVTVGIGTENPENVTIAEDGVDGDANTLRIEDGLQHAHATGEPLDDESDADHLISLEEMDDFRIQYDMFDTVDNGEWHPNTTIIDPLER
ncbi:MAG: hypothetical protein KC561_17790, partial [Myxococcales bacterium]|nr:hypothetical protein [Myxococcales bacterium]